MSLRQREEVQEVLWAARRERKQSVTCTRASVEERAVTAIISGNRAEQAVADAPLRYAGIDGRLVDLDTQRPSHLVPLISDNWRSHFRWRGQGPMPEPEREPVPQPEQACR